MKAVLRDFVKCRGRQPGWGRQLVEEARPLPIRLLRERGALTSGYSGTVTWADGSRAEIRFQGGKLEVVSPSGQAQGIPLSCRPCRLGGHEQLLVCPHCSRMRRTLYWAPIGILCRVCADLRYESQRLSGPLRGLLRFLKK